METFEDNQNLDIPQESQSNFLNVNEDQEITIPSQDLEKVDKSLEEVFEGVKDNPDLITLEPKDYSNRIQIVRESISNSKDKTSLPTTREINKQTLSECRDDKIIPKSLENAFLNINSYEQ